MARVIADYDNIDLSEQVIEEIIDDDLNIQDTVGLRERFTDYAQAQFPEALDYDIHHIRPREYVGSNDFDNLVPVPRDVHQQQFNSWWRDY